MITNQEQLNVAIGKGDVEQVRSLLEQGVNPIGVDSWKWPPLTQAVELENLEIIELLLSHGADVNQSDRYGITPLHIAVDISIDGTNQRGGKQSEEPTEIICYLLDNGANVHAKNHKGETPMDWAQNYNSEKITTLLSGQG